MIRILVAGEGTADVGSNHLLDSPAEEAEGRIGAIRVFVERILRESFVRNPPPIESGAERLSTIGRRHKANGFDGKVKAVIKEARIRGYDSLAVVVDRDRTARGERWELLEKGRTDALAAGEPLAERTAIGVAIETVEAWLLADVLALNQALELDPPAEQPTAPEELDGPPRTDRHPKIVLGKIIARAMNATAPSLEEIARRARLDMVEKACPKGFGAFAESVRGLCRRPSGPD